MWLDDGQRKLRTLSTGEASQTINLFWLIILLEESELQSLNFRLWKIQRIDTKAAKQIDRPVNDAEQPDG